MKTLSIIIFTIVTFFGFNFDKQNNTHSENAEEIRKGLIEEVVNIETEIAKASCFCRIGYDKGPRLDEYPNSIHDLGRLKTYGGINAQSQSNDDECGRRCSQAAFQWANTQSNDQLCQRLRKAGSQKLVAYSKVGTRKWSIRQTLKIFKCCSSGGGFACPSGWGAENTNFPGYCSKAVCAPLVKGDRRLYNEDKSIWGFIWKDMIYQLKRGTSGSVSWSSCN